MKARAKKVLCLVLALLLTGALFPPTLAEAAYIDNPHWKETTAAAVTQLYNSRQSFVVMFYSSSCFNSGLRKTMIDDWMTKYNFDVYGVDMEQYNAPNWVWSAIGAQSATTPFICIVEKGAASCYTAKDSMRSIQKRLQEFLGVYNEDEIDFTRIDTETYNSYSTHASTASSLYCLTKAEIPTVLWNKAQEIVQGISGDRAKVKAIYDWVTTNIYYNYGMLNGTVSRQVSALETYVNESSVCEGYANLTQAFCNAVGIPCRVVSGYATGVDTDSTVEDVWTLYQAYLDSGNLEAFSPAMRQYRNHAWNEAYVNGKWIILDPTWGSNNDYYPDARGRISGTPTDDYFDPAMESFCGTHLFYTDYSQDLTVSLRGQSLKVQGTLTAEERNAASQCILAAYDAKGRLLTAERLTVTGTSFSHTLENAGNAVRVKLILLNGRQAPVCAPYVGQRP